MADDIYAGVGANVRQARERLGMTQGSLAEATGLARTSITNIENGNQSIYVHQLVSLARALKSDPAALLRGVEALRDEPAPAARSAPIVELLDRLGSASGGRRR